MMLLDFIKNLLGIKKDVHIISHNVMSNNVVRKNVNYSTPDFDLKNNNVVHNENKTEKEIEDLYAEIRVLQAQNREKIEKKKLSYKIQ